MSYALYAPLGAKNGVFTCPSCGGRLFMPSRDYFPVRTLLECVNCGHVYEKVRSATTVRNRSVCN